jgi:DNA-binding NarL/FixJ family response regulator
MNQERSEAQSDRLLAMLEALLELDAITLDDAMVQAAQRLAEALAADKVDVFLHDQESDCLVALGTSQTPMGQKEQALGLDRLAIVEGGRAVEVLQTGRSLLARHADREGSEPRALIEQLGIRSSINVALEIQNERRGVIVACAATPEFFAERDLRFVEAVARWIALVAERAAHREVLAAQLAEQALRVAAEEALELLTRRQQEVARLVAAGLSNAEIGQRLVVTSGTVANHMEDILRRLGLKSRSQVAVWAVERGLYQSAGKGSSR